MDGTAAVRTIRWHEAIGPCLFVCAGFALLGFLALRTPVRYGDAFEYYYQLEALANHGTPDIRNDDVLAVNARFPKEGIDAPPVPPYGTELAPDGRRYGIHFWAYALSAVPAKALLTLLGGNPLAALPVTNGFWFLIATCAGLFLGNGSSRRWVSLTLVVAISPVLWYLVYTGTEVYSWALTFLAVLALDARRYPLAAFLAALSALQNPATVLVAVVSLLTATYRKEWRSAAFSVLMTSISLLPFAFFQWHFGKPSLIAGGFLKLSNLSWVRSWGLATDLNQGLLPYAPLLTLGAAIGAFALMRRRSPSGGLILMALLGMAAIVQTQSNWNAGCLGLQRYLVWMLPLIGWIFIEGLENGQLFRPLLATAVSVQATILFFAAPARMDYVEQNALAQFVLGRAPWFYVPDPEIFMERQLHGEFSFDDPYAMPIGFARKNGRVTKLLIDAASVSRLPEKYHVEVDYFEQIRKEAGQHSGRFYAHPPRGAVTARQLTNAGGT